ncbi:enoyl-CoA hydratase [Chryseobacterium sp. WG14]|uniref:enoyl-CoA hydratase n=1 Tax=Chryseobacterium sp. WG14 TaxID=2926909 RepID=UPI00211E86FE|nr:enoyl-CoA hydratase [Chryseobacterium sp. WG14]MCQ9638187.1 enoyl-CoA hydratase [Chryseobacterium sp. WG14]
MVATEEVFTLIKKERKFPDDIKNYTIKISTSNNFERENLIGIYKIRNYSAKRNENYELAQQIEILVSSLENCLDNNSRFVSISGDQYCGMFYLGQNWDQVIEYLEAEIDKNGNVLF